MDTIMCIQWRSYKLGCSYYSGSTLELFVMKDVREQKDFEYLTMLIAQILPRLIILPDSSDEALFDYIEREHGTSIEVKKVSGKDFSFEKGRYMLLNWYINQLQQLQQPQHRQWPTASSDIHTMTEEEVVTADDDITMADRNVFLMDPEEGNKTHAYLQLEGLIHLEHSQLTIGCAGVLLTHLQKVEQEEGHMNEDENETATHDLSIQPISLRTFSCEKCMHVNADTIKSLCIFDHETHPNMHQKHEKESLSLFGLLNKTASVLGKQMLAEWISKPTCDKEVLDYRHEAIRFFLQPDMRDAMQELSSNLKHIKNIHRLLAKVKESKTKSNDWQHILKFAYYTIRTFGLLSQQAHQNGQNVAFLKKIRNLMPVAEIMKSVGSNINNIIDFDTSKLEGRIIVKENVGSDLDLLRRKYDALDDYLLQISQEISATLPVGLGAALNVVYFPQLGYLITLPQYHHQHNSSRNSKDNNSSSSSSHISDYYARYLTGFELQFTTADNLYYKNAKTKELDETIGDIHAMIADKEIEIIQELSECVLQHAAQFTQVVEVLSELDCLLSLAMVALRFNYVEPTMKMDDTLVIVQGRHPLQELCVETFIPNDTYLQGGKGFGTRRRNDDDQLSILYQEGHDNPNYSVTPSAPVIDSRHDVIVIEDSETNTQAPNQKNDKEIINISTNNPEETIESNKTIRHTTTEGNTTGEQQKSTKPTTAYGSHYHQGEKGSEMIIVEEEEQQQQQQHDERYSSVQVVTGANFSGKSVYLKQIALIVYMAHVGSFVPADRAIIGLTDKLFTRISTSETVSKPQSAFAFDIQQLQRALNSATNHSLVIIDEFGKGTDSSDGAALFCSVIGYDLSKGEKCPKIVASTHFHDLISQDILSTQDGITLSQTEIITKHHKERKIGEEVDEEEGDEVVFLYRIVPGKGPSASFGIWCAGIAGLPSITIKRAIELSDLFIQGKPMTKIRSVQDEENYKMLEIIKNDFLERDVDQLNPQELIASVQALFKKKEDS